MVASRSARIVVSSIADVAAVVALVIPAAVSYLRWPLLALYALVSYAVWTRVWRNRWIASIVGARATRISHGLEHATLAVLTEAGLPALHGFTYGLDRFMVALQGTGHAPRAVRDACERAIGRILAGEHALAYQPGCGTSEAVSAVTLWLVYVTAAACTLALSGSTPIFFALSVVAFRFWLACDTALGLVAQRLFTVSVDFATARVILVESHRSLGGRVAPDDETWFAVVVDVQVRATHGGLVSPGVL
jgi:hypothetical protein